MTLMNSKSTEPAALDAGEKVEPPDRKSLFRAAFSSPGFFLATGAGAGLSPAAPGTLGALQGVPLAWAINHYFDWPWQIVIVVILNLVGIPICSAAAKRIGRKDPGAVIWDEIATVPITFLFVPAAMMNSPLILAAGFGLHRLFDISKFPPANRLEKLEGGLGIMSDDWAAGIWSCAILHAIIATGIFG